MDSWTKIQSGSIYYVLNKLEKEGLIILTKEIGSGTKTRKIYSITEAGKTQLKELVKEELRNPISEAGSNKFIIYPLLNTLSKEEMMGELKGHIQKLNDQKEYIEKCQKLKVNEKTLALEKLTFEMMLSNLEYQIKWHMTLMDNLEQSIKESEEISKLISAFDFSNVEEATRDSGGDIEKLKYQILNDPDTAQISQ